MNLALSLIETLVKNCNSNFHREVATPKFMAQMGRLAKGFSEKTGRENLEVADKVCLKRGMVVGGWVVTDINLDRVMMLSSGSRCLSIKL